MKYVEKSLALAKELRFNFGIAKAYNALGGFYVEKSDFKTGKDFVNKSIALIPQKKDYRFKKLFAQTQQSLGVICHYQEEYSTAVKYYLEAAKIFKSINDDSSLLIIYNNLASVHAIMLDKENALKYAEECYLVSKKVNDPFKTSMACVAVASCKIELKDYVGIEKYLTESKKICDSIQNYVLLGRTYGLYGQFNVEKKQDLKKGIEFFEKALSSFKKAGNQYEIATSHQRLGEAYARNNDYVNARSELNKAMSLSKEIGVLQVEFFTLKTLSELEENNNNPKEALQLLKQYNTLNDSINTESKRKQIANLEAKYESEKKEAQIKTLEQEKQIQNLSLNRKNTLIYVFIGTLFGLLLTGFLAYRNYASKQIIQTQQIRELEQERQMLAADSILKGQEEERTRLAKDLHDGLGGMLSGVKMALSSFSNTLFMKGNQILPEESAQRLDRAVAMLDNSIQELRLVARNLMPESLLRFGLKDALQDFTQNISQSGELTVDYQTFGLEIRLEQNIEIIVFRIVQELLNNVIKHASASQVLVQLVQEANRLSVTVEDNGKGFDTSTLETAKGIGWTNIQSRVDYLKGKLDIDTQTGKGTSVHIDLPV
ncbi:MAG: tetratricopeptide repeat protein [Verrucomicrobia bacterium]|nr:tetratricopeptide repeat protein [Cytophagales bacterium]